MGHQDKQAAARAAAEVKAERKSLAGLSRTIKLRICPRDAQAAAVNQIIGATRYVWNTIWPPILAKIELERRQSAEAKGLTDGTADEERKRIWREAWKAHPDPKSSTDLKGAARGHRNR